MVDDPRVHADRADDGGTADMAAVAAPYQDLVANFMATMEGLTGEFEKSLAEATEAMKELMKDVEEESAPAQTDAGSDKKTSPATPWERPNSLRVFDK